MSGHEVRFANDLWHDVRGERFGAMAMSDVQRDRLPVCYVEGLINLVILHQKSNV